MIIFLLIKNLKKWSRNVSFSTYRNNLLYEIFYNYCYLWHVIAHFGKSSFMRPYIIKWRRSFGRPSVNQSVYTAHDQTKRPTASKFSQRYWRGFSRPRSDFFKNRSRFFRMILKNIFWDFSAN